MTDAAESMSRTAQIDKVSRTGPSAVNRCSECGKRISSRATTCSSTCRTARWRRLREEEVLHPLIEREADRRAGDRLELSRTEWEIVRDTVREVSGNWNRNVAEPGFVGREWHLFQSGRRRVVTKEQLIQLVGAYPLLAERLLEHLEDSGREAA